MTEQPLPPDANQPAESHLLEDLADLTGLFNPEQIWHTEEKLDDLDEQEAAQATAPPLTGAAPAAAH